MIIVQPRRTVLPLLASRAWLIGYGTVAMHWEQVVQLGQAAQLVQVLQPTLTWETYSVSTPLRTLITRPVAVSDPPAQDCLLKVTVKTPGMSMSEALHPVGMGTLFPLRVRTPVDAAQYVQTPVAAVLVVLEHVWKL